MQAKDYLNAHGQTVECAQWVVDNYSDREDYKDNKTVQLWLQGSIQVINEANAELIDEVNCDES